MKHPNYPCPCLECKQICATSSGQNHKRCVPYRKWFLWWWEYFRKIFGIDTVDLSAAQKFTYHHPEEIKDRCRLIYAENAAQIRAVSAKKPCARCGKEPTCDIPCDSYLLWYNESLAWIRKQVGNTSHKEEI